MAAAPPDPPENQDSSDPTPELQVEIVGSSGGSVPVEALAVAVPAGQPLPAPKIPGYEILGELGRGGRGVVYEARHSGLNRTVALKMLLAGAAAGPENLARLRAEAEAVAALRHPHVVQVYDFGTFHRLPFFTMELCPGGSLARQWADGPADPREAAAAVEAVARGVAYAHAQGVVHRDLKPQNVLIGEDGRPKVTDFGLAKRVNPAGELTVSGAVLGTPAYMAPEQAGGQAKRIGPAADVWALGAMLYRGLTGELPFRGDGPLTTLRKVLDEEPARPRSVNRSVPRDLEVVCLKCLRKDPGRRYVSADALANDIRRWLDGRPIHARPVGETERLWKWVRRHPWASAAVATLAASTAASLLFARCAVEARGAAAANAALAERRSRESERATAEADAYARFLEDDILAAVRPKGADGGRGVDLSFAEALRAAEREIPQRFAGQPLAEARARHALGVTWRNRSRFGKAIQNLRRALELRREHAGDDADATLESRNSLALALSQAGRFGEAVPLLEEALRRARGTRGDGHPDTLALRVNLASAYLNTGRHREAVPLYERAVTLSPDRETGFRLTAMTGLAEARRLAGDPNRAVAMYKKILAVRLRENGEPHAATLAARKGLANAHLDAGHTGEAIALLERAFAQCGGLFGAGGLMTVNTANDLATAYMTAGRAGDSARLLEGAIGRAEVSLGRGHRAMIAARHNLGLAYMRLGRVGAALPIFEGVLKQCGPADRARFAASAGTNLTEAYRRLGRADDAIRVGRDALGRAVRLAGPADPTALSARAELSAAYRAAGRFGEQEALLREGLASQPAGSPAAAELRAELGVCLFMQREFDAAEATFLASYDGLKRWAAAHPEAAPRVRAAARRLALFYKKIGRADRADRWQAVAAAPATGH